VRIETSQHEDGPRYRVYLEYSHEYVRLEDALEEIPMLLHRAAYRETP
jgi:hypothetical protein